MELGPTSSISDVLSLQYPAVDGCLPAMSTVYIGLVGYSSRSLLKSKSTSTKPAYTKADLPICVNAYDHTCVIGATAIMKTVRMDNHPSRQPESRYLRRFYGYHLSTTFQ